LTFQDPKWPWQKLGPPLAEWMLQVKEKTSERGLEGQAVAIDRSLSAFKVVEKYSEATMWGKLVLPHLPRLVKMVEL